MNLFDYFTSFIVIYGNNKPIYLYFMFLSVYNYYNFILLLQFITMSDENKNLINQVYKIRNNNQQDKKESPPIKVTETNNNYNYYQPYAESNNLYGHHEIDSNQNNYNYNNQNAYNLNSTSGNLDIFSTFNISMLVATLGVATLIIVIMVLYQ